MHVHILSNGYRKQYLSAFSEHGYLHLDCPKSYLGSRNVVIIYLLCSVSRLTFLLAENYGENSYRRIGIYHTEVNKKVKNDKEAESLLRSCSSKDHWSLRTIRLV